MKTEEASEKGHCTLKTYQQISLNQKVRKNIYVKQINELSLRNYEIMYTFKYYLQDAEKEDQSKPKLNRRKDILMLRAKPAYGKDAHSREHS